MSLRFTYARSGFALYERRVGVGAYIGGSQLAGASSQLSGHPPNIGVLARFAQLMGLGLYYLPPSKAGELYAMRRKVRLFPITVLGNGLPGRSKNRRDL